VNITARFAPIALPIALLAMPIAASSATVDSGQSTAMQIVADATLIDAQCQGINANFGMAFKLAEGHGIEAADIMPVGGRRAEFQTAYHQRIQATSLEELCGPLVSRYNQSFPGLFTNR
jgi:hypothetical protein